VHDQDLQLRSSSHGRRPASAWRGAKPCGSCCRQTHRTVSDAGHGKASAVWPVAVLMMLPNHPLQLSGTSCLNDDAIIEPLHTPDM